MVDFQIGDKVTVFLFDQCFVDLKRLGIVSFEGEIVDLSDINALIKADIDLHTVNKSRFSNYISDKTDLMWVEFKHMQKQNGKGNKNL